MKKKDQNFQNYKSRIFARYIFVLAVIIIIFLGLSFRERFFTPPVPLGTFWNLISFVLALLLGWVVSPQVKKWLEENYYSKSRIEFKKKLLTLRKLLGESVKKDDGARFSDVAIRLLLITNNKSVVTEYARMVSIIRAIKENDKEEEDNNDWNDATEKSFSEIVEYSKLAAFCLLQIKKTQLSVEDKDKDKDKDSKFRVQAEKIHQLTRGLVNLKSKMLSFSLLPSIIFGLITCVFLWFQATLQGRDWSVSWLSSSLFLFVSVALARSVFIFLDLIIRKITELTETYYDDIFVALLGAPSGALLLLVGVDLFFKKIPSVDSDFIKKSITDIFSDNFLKASIVLVAGWLTVFVFNYVIVYALQRWANKTEQHYDDMFVRIVQLFGTFVIVAIFIGLELAAFQGEISKWTDGENVLLPYSIIVSTFGVLLGYATREGVENFFGGILLQVEKPFEKGNRVLVDGRLCDVLEIGMRSTTFYDVEQSVLISVPNRKLASENIVNLSKPDISLRVENIVAISPNSQEGQLWAEGILLDISYLDDEIDQMRIDIDQIPDNLRRLGRLSLMEIIKSIDDVYDDKIDKIKVLPITGNRSEEIFAWKEFKKCINRIKQFRLEYDKYIVRIETSAADNPKNDDLAEQSLISKAAFFMAISIKSLNPKLEDKEIYKAIYNRYGEDVFSAKRARFTLLYTDQNKTDRKLTRLKKIVDVYNSHDEVPLLDLVENYRQLLYYRLAIVEKINALIEDVEFLASAVAEEIGYDYLIIELINEIHKEPRVFAETVTSLGQLKLRHKYFTTYMGRRDGVVHQTEKEIRRLFAIVGIPFDLEIKS